MLGTWAQRLPTIVIVPGAWHSPIHYHLLGLYLNKLGYETVSDRLPSCNSPFPNSESIAVDAAAIRANILSPRIANGEEIVLIMHSYGGAPGSCAAVGASKQDLQANGKTGGIIGLIYLAGFLLNEGDSLIDLLPGRRFDPWVMSKV